MTREDHLEASRMPVPVFIVNLPDQVERRQFITTQLKRLGPSFRIEFIEAIDGRKLSEAEVRADHDPAFAQAYANRDMTRGEIGCALSHRLIYRNMIEQQIPGAWVLEDDALIGAHAPEVVEALSRKVKPGNPWVVLLTDAFHPAIWKRRLTGRYAMSRAWNSFSTFGYYVTLAAARALEREQTPIRRASDWWEQWEKTRAIRVFGVWPPCIFNGFIQHDSAIGVQGRLQARSTRFERFERKIRKLVFQFRSWNWSF